MEQYTYEDQYKGKPRKLLILLSPGAEEYRIFCDADFLGSIKPAESADQEIKWKTEYNILKPIADKIGSYILSVS